MMSSICCSMMLTTAAVFFVVMGMTFSFSVAPINQLKHFVEIGDGFFHLRSKFYIAYVLDIGTHMALVRRPNGRFLVLDVVQLSESEQAEFDIITNNGKWIDGVIGTHPFHTTYFPSFYEKYPNAAYYGSPRHHRACPQVKWAGMLAPNDTRSLKMFEPDIEMRIPDGAEFFNPLPENFNHFTNVFVFHPQSKTVFNDDTIVNWRSSVLSPVHYIKFIQGLHFHPSMVQYGIKHDSESPGLFIKWMRQLLEDWQFDNLCTAHCENLIGGAHDAVTDLLNKSEDTIMNIPSS